MSGGPARRVAEALERRGLALPGWLLADAHRPLAPLISDVGAALGPLIGVAVGHRADDVRGLVDAPRGIDELVAELDPRARGETRGQPG